MKPGDFVTYNGLIVQIIAVLGAYAVVQNGITRWGVKLENLKKAQSNLDKP